MDVGVRIEFIVLHEILDRRKKLKIENDMQPADEFAFERDDMVDMESMLGSEFV